MPARPPTAALARSLTAVFATTALVALSACTQRLPLAPGCRGTLSGASSPEPPSHCFYFPSGLALDPFGDLLYVTNPNADLSFSGGSLVTVDLPRHERAVACYRQFGEDAVKENGQPVVPGTPLAQRCGVSSCAFIRGALTTESDLGAVLALDAQVRARGEDPSAYDRCYCERDALDPSVVNCESQRFILRDQARKIGNFSGEIAMLAEDPEDYTDAKNLNKDLKRTLYLPVRGDPSLTVIDVTRRLVTDASRRLVDANPTRLTTRCSGDPADQDNCDKQHRIQRTPLGDELLMVEDDPTQGTRSRFDLPIEPFGVTLDTGCKDPAHTYLRYTDKLDRSGVDVGAGNGVAGPACLDPKTNRYNRGVYRTLLMSHLATGDVSTFNLNGPPTLASLASGPYSDDRPEGPGIPVLVDVRNLGFLGDNSGRQGAFAIAPRIRGDITQPWYATSRLSGQINSFRLGRDRVPLLPPPGYGTTDPDFYRALSPEDKAQQRLYMPVEGPALIPGLVFSIAGAFPMDSATVRQVDVRDMLFEPDGNRAFMVLNRPPAIAVLDTTPDPRSTPPGVPVNRILRAINIGPGPSRLALSRAPALVSGAGPRPLRTLLYVALFTSGELAVVDPESGMLINSIFIGRGPNSVVLNYGGPSDGGHINPCADPYVSKDRPQLQCPVGDTLRVGSGPRAYVTSYIDNVVTVVDLDPTSQSYHRVVSRIGLPAPKVQ